MIEFKLECIPPKTTNQARYRVMTNKATGKSFVGKTKSNDADYLLLLLNQHKPQEMITDAVKLEVVWVYPYRKAEPKKNRHKRIPCTSKPDCDNLAKGFIDQMTRLGYWKDDAQIYNLDFSKYWSADEDVGIYVKITKEITK